MRRNGSLLTLLVLGSVACTPRVRALPEVPDGVKSEEDGAPSTPHRWSYAAGAGGPSSWASLPGSSCGNPDQSPIDVPLDVLAKVPAASGDDTLNAGETAESFELIGAALPLGAENDRRVLSLSGSAKVGLRVGEKTFGLSSVHLHVPAEHRLGGTEPDLEFEFSFEGDGAHYALSLLFRRGAVNPTLDALVTALPESSEYDQKSLVGMLDVAKLFDGKDLLVYDGSMSAPPCSPVTRLVFARVAELSADQLERLLRALPHPSARPLAEIGTRKVRLGSFSSSSVPIASPEKSPPTPSLP